MDKKKCTKMMEAGKCEDEKVAKKCMKTCDMCEDMGPKKSNIPELNHFGVIAGLFRQIGGHSTVDLCYFALFETFHYKND